MYVLHTILHIDMEQILREYGTDTYQLFWFPRDEKGQAKRIAILTDILDNIQTDKYLWI
jgi:hypothetical protein